MTLSVHNSMFPKRKKTGNTKKAQAFMFSRRSNMGFTTRSVRAKQIHKVMKTWIYAPINSRILFFNNGMMFIGCPLWFSGSVLVRRISCGKRGMYGVQAAFLVFRRPQQPHCRHAYRLAESNIRTESSLHIVHS